MLSSYFTQDHYTFEFHRRDVTVSRGMLIRLCQEGNIFGKLLLGSEQFKVTGAHSSGKISLLQSYNISSRVFCALLFAIRTGNGRIAYKYKLQLESIGGFKIVDRYTKKLTLIKQSVQTNINNEHTEQTQYPRKIVLDFIDEDEA